MPMNFANSKNHFQFCSFIAQSAVENDKAIIAFKRGTDLAYFKHIFASILELLSDFTQNKIIRSSRG